MTNRDHTAIPHDEPALERRIAALQRQLGPYYRALARHHAGHARRWAAATALHEAYEAAGPTEREAALRARDRCIRRTISKEALYLKELVARNESLLNELRRCKTRLDRLVRHQADL